MKKFVGEILGGDGSNYPGDCEQYDINAETHREAFEKLVAKVTDLEIVSRAASIGGPIPSYPGDTERVTLSVWEDTIPNYQTWNPKTKEWEDEEEEED